jgi:Cupin-like domain
MPRPGACLAYHRTYLRRLSSSSPALQWLRPVESVLGDIEDIDIDDFRKRAFTPERPLLIKRKLASGSTDIFASRSSIPAAAKWFITESIGTPDQTSTRRQRVVPSYKYLSSFQDTILPYELTCDSVGPSTQSDQNVGIESGQDGPVLPDLLETPTGGTFHRFSAPLALFLEACAASSSLQPRLYIAQAQIADLPRQLQDDLPTPTLIKAAGKGDVYDANIWVGLPPTYTPLHRDPNPNLFVQLASSKRVRLYEPSIGAGIFRDVQRSIGQSVQINLRGEEMMEGPEQSALHEAIWGSSAAGAGFEAVVNPGEALFIPKGWWHTIKSIGTDVTASVNWWFR